MTEKTLWRKMSPEVLINSRLFVLYDIPSKRNAISDISRGHKVVDDEHVGDG
jgi:hypothetical protein